MTLKIEYVDINKLRPYEKNARKHGEKDVNAIIESIKNFGFNDPIGVWGDVVVEGHGRLIAAKRLEMLMVPVVRLDHLTDEQRRAYALAHNKTAELSKWDKIALEIELDSLPEIDMGAFGFFENESIREQKLSTGGELELSDFKNDQFEYECPECGFRFNLED